MEWANIKTYPTNAYVGYEDTVFGIDYDGMEWDSEEDWREWATEQLAPIAEAPNYNEILTKLNIVCDRNIKRTEPILPLHEQLANIRRSRGISQEELAKRTEYTQANIARIESGANSTREDVLAKIAAALGVRLCVCE